MAARQERCGAEIREFALPRRVEKDVLRLDVAVQHFVIMEVGQAPEDVPSVAPHALQMKSPELMEHLLFGAAGRGQRTREAVGMGARAQGWPGIEGKELLHFSVNGPSPKPKPIPHTSAYPHPYRYPPWVRPSAALR